MTAAKHLAYVWLLPCLLAPAAPAQEAASRLEAPPPFDGTNLDFRATRGWFGDDRNVELLARLRDDPDPVVRARAAQSLGETHNAGARPYLEAAVADEDPDVRAVAALAGAELGPAGTELGRAGAEVVRRALGDESPVVLRAALHAAARLGVRPVASEVAALLRHADAGIVVLALDVLTEAPLVADADRLRALLGHADARVRAAALRNIALYGAEGASFAEAVLSLAAEDAGIPLFLRARAVEALGAVGADGAEARAAFEAAAKSDSPLLRRAAVRAYRAQRRAEKIAPFLSDRSAGVRIAAVRAAGALRCGDCVDRLFELLWTAPLDPKDPAPADLRRPRPERRMHYAIRRALVRIGTDSVAQGAAAFLEAKEDDIRALDPGPKGEVDERWLTPARQDVEHPHDSGWHRRHLMIRNGRAAAWLLGELKSPAAIKTLLAWAAPPGDGGLKLDNEVKPRVAEALGKIGDRSAIPPLLDELKRCPSQGVRFLRAQKRPMPPYVEWREETACELIGALARLQARAAVPTILAVADVELKLGQGSTRLNDASAAAARVLGALTTDENRAAVAAAVIEGLDNSYDLLAHYEFARAAGALRVDAAAANLRRVLDEDRQDARVMRAAAWALQQITGRTPKIPQPKPRQSDMWIVRQVIRRAPAGDDED